MKEKSFVFLIIVLGCSELIVGEVRYDNYKVFELIPMSSTQIKVLKELRKDTNYNFWHEISPVGIPMDVMVAPSHQKKFSEILINNSLNYNISISNVQKLIDASRVNFRKRDTFGWEIFHTLDQIYDWMKDLAKNDKRVTLLKAGQSYEKRDILGVKLTFRPGNENRSVFLESNIHAREWISSAVNTYILKELLTSSDPKLRKIAENHDWYIVPVVNPDGYVYSHTEDRLWRKSRVPHSKKCYGTDLNRNWDFAFKGVKHEAFATACDNKYAGKHVFSEPETKSLSEFISKIGPKLEAYIAFHSYGQYLLIPYGNSSQHLNNYDDLFKIGTRAIKSLAKQYGTQFITGNIVDLLYPASGVSMDWVKQTYKTPITYTFELRDKGKYKFLLPPNQIIPCGKEVVDSLVTIFQEFDKILHKN